MVLFLKTWMLNIAAHKPHMPLASNTGQCSPSHSPSKGCEEKIEKKIDKSPNRPMPRLRRTMDWAAVVSTKALVLPIFMNINAMAISNTEIVAEAIVMVSKVLWIATKLMCSAFCRRYSNVTGFSYAIYSWGI